MLHGDEAVSVRRVSDDNNFDIFAGNLIENFTLLRENRGIFTNKIIALHTLTTKWENLLESDHVQTRKGSNKEDKVNISECFLGIGSGNDTSKKRECAVLKFKNDAWKVEWD